MTAPRIANLGAEEGDDWRRAAGTPAVQTLAKLWRQVVDAEPQPFAWLPQPDQATAWLNTEDAAREAGQPLAGSAPECVRAVHDKAFALRVAEDERLVPRALLGLVDILEPEALAPVQGAAEWIANRVAKWPEWTGGRFTLKPRFGSSGRGRFGGRAQALDLASLGGALPRLRDRGGAILEPWLERTVDLSAQLTVSDTGGIILLGTATLLCDPSGVYRGHLATFDRKGRTTSGQRHDEPLREAAALVATAAAAQGLRGPCGVDGFAFRLPDGGEGFRPVCELNARYTAGTVALGLFRQHLAELKNGLALGLEERGWLHFSLQPPAAGWPEPRPGEVVRVLLDAEAGEAGPALCASRDPGALEIGTRLP